MEKTKFHIFFVWLLAIALIFSNIPLQQIFAEEGGTGTSKDVSDRLVFGDNLSVEEKISSQTQSPIYEEGRLLKSSSNVLEGRELTFKYIWEIPEDNFLGKTEGLNHKGERINPGDKFRIELPAHELLYFVAFDEYKPIVKEYDYGKWRIQRGSDKKYFIEGIFGDYIKDKGAGENVTSLKEGHFTIIATAAKAGGPINLNLNKSGEELTITIVPNKHASVWNMEPFYKQGSADKTKGYISWSLITGFDNLKAVVEGTTAKNKKEIVVYDFFPDEVEVLEIQLKVPVYRPTPKNNFDEEGNPTTDIPAGKLSWRSGHEMFTKYMPSDATVIKKEDGETLPDFVTRIKQLGVNSSDGMPVIGYYEGHTNENGESGNVVVVGLGDSPNKILSYAELYKKTKSKPVPTLLEYLKKELAEDKIDQDQFDIMKRVYLGDGEDNKVLAWSVGIKVAVDKNTTKSYKNFANIEYIPIGTGSGGPVVEKREASQAVNFIALDSGVQGLKKLSFEVKKVWQDKNGSDIEAPQDQIQVDVYNGTEIVKGHSIVLSKENNWKGKIAGLPIFEGTNRIQYTVKEHANVEGYESTVAANAANSDGSIDLTKGFTITNKQKDIADPMSIKVIKKWEGSETTKKPVIFYLQKKEGGKWKNVGEVELKEGKWDHTFTGLTFGDEYNVVEEKLLGYESSDPDIDKTDLHNLTYTFTNKQVFPNPLNDIEVTKVWADGKALSSATIQLYSQIDGEGEVFEKEVILSPPTWKYVFQSYPTQTSGSSPKTIKYIIKEITPSGYTEKVSDVDKSESGKQKFIVTNTLTNEVIPKKDIPVEKKWVGGTGEKVTVHLVLDDGTDSKISTIILNDSNNWKGSFKNIKMKTDEGQVLSFKVVEEPIAGYDAPAISGNVNDGFTVTNTKTTTTTTTASGGGEEETTESSTEKTTEKTSPSSAQASTDTTETNTETTTEATTESADASTLTTEATTVTTTTTEAAPVVVITTAPTAPATTRTFEFIEIAEDIPLGVKTTAPINLELVLIEESVPLGGLPYTYSIPAEILVGIGMLILTIGLTIGRKL